MAALLRLSHCQGTTPNFDAGKLDLMMPFFDALANGSRNFTFAIAQCLVCFWGVSMVGMAFSTSFGPLLANRFLLGLFEAGCLPLFTVIATSFYRKIECTWAIAMFYSQNGIGAHSRCRGRIEKANSRRCDTANIFGSFLAWAVSFAQGRDLYVYQILFLIVGLMTICTVPYLIWKLDNGPATARFLTPEERLWAVERLRDNNTGIVNSE